MSTSGGITDARLAVQSGFGPKHAVVTTQRSVRRVDPPLRASRASASPASPPTTRRRCPTLGAAAVRPRERLLRHDREPLAGRPRGGGARGARAGARRRPTCAPRATSQSGLGAGAFGNGKGLFAYHRNTSNNYTLTVRTADGTGSGWAAADHPDFAQLDVRRIATRATEKARLSRTPVGDRARALHGDPRAAGGRRSGAAHRQLHRRAHGRRGAQRRS